MARPCCAREANGFTTDSDLRLDLAFRPPGAPALFGIELKCQGPSDRDSLYTKMTMDMTKIIEGEPHRLKQDGQDVPLTPVALGLGTWPVVVGFQQEFQQQGVLGYELMRNAICAGPAPGPASIGASVMYWRRV